MGTDTKTAEPAAATVACYRLIYRSHSLLPRQGKDDEALAEILKVARIKNANLGITGALMLYDDWFAQVLEGPQAAVEALYTKIKADPRHHAIRLSEAGPVPKRQFEKWAMAIVAEHHEPDMPMVATTGGLSQGAPWRVSLEQEAVLTRLRDLTRGYGRSS
ncbi:MAG: BLUF domain-containing protein [Pseudomonadota bacterium]